MFVGSPGTPKQENNWLNCFVTVARKQVQGCMQEVTYMKITYMIYDSHYIFI